MASPGDQSTTAPLANLVVLTAGRSGSNYLQELMIGNGMGDPNEYFNPNFGFAEAIEAGQSTEDYLVRLQRERSRGGVFGVKIMASHLQIMAENSRQKDWEVQSDLLVPLFPGARFVWLRRDDRIRQAISSWRASKTGEFRRWRDKEHEVTELPELDPDEVDKHLGYLLWTDGIWGAFFSRCRIEALVLIYENMVANPSRELGRIIESLGGTVPDQLNAKVRIARQADERTDDLVAQYLQARPENKKYESLESSEVNDSEEA